MPRYDELDGYIGRAVRAVTLDGKRMDGELQSVAHLDVDDLLSIGGISIRLGKIRELFVVEGENKFRVWPPYDAEALGAEPELVALDYDPVLYETAAAMVGREVAVYVGADRFFGVLEAMSSKTDTPGPILHLSQGEGKATLQVRLGAVTKITDAADEPQPVLTADELEKVILPGGDDYPFTGKAKRRLGIEKIARAVVAASRKYDEPIILTLGHAAAFYGLDLIATQSVQAYIARLQDAMEPDPDLLPDPDDDGKDAPSA